MKRILLCAWMIGAVSDISFAQQNVRVSSFTASPANEVSAGMLQEKINLQSQATPLVSIKNIKTETVATLPEGVRASNSFEPDVLVATERKKPVAFIQVPGYRKINGRIEKLLSCDLEITEQETTGRVARKPTGVANSILASGSWYKIAVTNRGVYKIDYNFLQNLGLNPANINPANIRLYGNGGTVLGERVSSTQPDDLIENAIFVSSAGSSFGPGDYILFYANGPVLWSKDSLNQSFKHTSNYYENQSYYFLNFDLGAGKRIATEQATNPASYSVTAFDDYRLIEGDSTNLGGIGKQWWGYRMNSINTATLTQNIPVTLGPVTGSVKISATVGNTNTSAGNQVQMRFNGGPATVFSLGMAPADYTMISLVTSASTEPEPADGSSTLQFRYLPAGNGAAYVDYARFNYRRKPIFQGGQLAFRDWQTAGLPAGQYAAYTLQNAPAGLQVWDITNSLQPVALQGTAAGGSYTFSRAGNSLKEFIAFDGAQYLTPVALAGNPIANQDLHALGQADLIIVTCPEFKAAAEELAAFHREKDNMRVNVALVGQIYNEFSSGGQDIGGIRNFIRMFYDRANSDAEMPKNVLFFGAASYDYKNRIASNSNFVPTFQSEISSVSTRAYASDDFYSLLDEGEDISGAGLPDVGTGRIPALTAEEAANAVAKIKAYTSPASFGPWKNAITYVADDMDDDGSMDHMKDCEDVNVFFPDSFSALNLYKVYADAYNEVSTPGGGRYPMVNKAIDDQVYNGTLFMSYSGHGSPERWAHEAILTADDYGNWKNRYKLPVMVTATCDFGRFDDPEHRSAGARLMISPTGGSIAMVTTTQVVFASQNTRLNKEYVAAQFSRDADGKWRTLGEALREAKTRYSDENNHRYVVLGDPALQLQMPAHIVRTDKLEMTDNGSTYETDTIKALGRYTLSGSVTDKNGLVLSDFNGPVYVTIFDKARRIQTVNPTRATKAGAATAFRLQTNIVAKVKGSVRNGIFSVDFVAPKDINYDYGYGKVSYYANSETTDAAGVDTGLTVGDFNRNAAADNTPPVVQPFIDNDKFRNGGVTGPNPLLYVKFYDDNGINVSGSSVGHDLVAILDGDEQNPYVMNNYYETEQNDYRKGHVSFPLYNLPEGVHTLKVRAWDVYNNSGEGTVTFEVKNKDKGFISDLYNYPNPVTDITHIVFQHNQEGEQMDVNLQIFNASGALVRSISQHMEATGNRTEMIWDGLDQRGSRMAKGVYFYRLQARTGKGVSATAYQKLVLLR